MLGFYLTVTVLVGYLTLASQCSVNLGKILYVITSKDSTCPNGIPQTQCHTLHWYSQNINTSFASNTKMVFLNGSHILTKFIRVLNHDNFTMTGSQSLFHTSNGLPQPASRIICVGQSNNGLLFINSSNISIRNLIFDNCSGQTKFSDNFSPNVALSFEDTLDVELYQLVINNTKGIGLQFTNVFGNISVVESAFINAKGDEHIYGGNTRFWFDRELQLGVETNVIIRDSHFLYGKDQNYYRNATGLQIFILCQGVHFMIESIVAEGNSGYSGGNVGLILADFGSNVSTVTIKNSKIIKGYAKMGAAGLKVLSLINAESDIFENVTFLQIFNCIFDTNQVGGAIYIEHRVAKNYFPKNRQRDIKIQSCLFEHNTGKAAAMMVVQKIFPNYIIHLTPQFILNVESCIFANNGMISDEQSSIIQIIHTKGIHVSRCTFENNHGSVVSLRNSIVNFHDNVTFINNSAYFGAALKICETSFVFLGNQTELLFQNNSAQKGGALYAQQGCLDTQPACRFQLAIDQIGAIEELRSHIKLKFVNNTALLVGDAIYGGLFDDCYVLQSYEVFNGTHHSHLYDSKDLFQEIFDTENQIGPSSISSPPYGVCFCTFVYGKLESACEYQTSNVSVYPGESFNVSLTTIGQYKKVSFGLIAANLVNAHHDDKLVGVDDPLTQHKGCTDLSYRILSGYSNVSINFSTTRYDNNVYPKQINATLSVSLRSCPFGFDLKSKRCGCHPLVYQMATNAKCNIDKKTIHIPAKIYHWFGCYHEMTSEIGGQNDSSMHCNLAVSLFCTDYCKSSAFSVDVVNISSFDKQCISGRRGVLCGACNPGLSQILGSRMCRQCSNWYLLFLIPAFLLVGVVAVFLLSFLNLTVSEGTISGFIVYVNIIDTHSYLFNNHGLISKVCRTFIKLFNCTLGVELCFYNGMDGYQQTWLNYAFIFYLFTIQGVIICLCRRFIFFTRLFGRNIVQVLATFLFLMYSPLLFTIIETFQCTQLKISAPNNTYDRKLVWYRDGNIPYLGLKHIPLFLVGLLCGMAVLWFTFSLLLVQCLQRRTHMACFKWVERMRPFFEAFTGPCHDSYRFWPGFLTFVRLGLYSLNTVTLTFSESHLQRKLMFLATVIVCVAILSFSCIFPHGVYKKWPLNMLEFSFFLNLCITSSLWTISMDNASAVVYTSIFIAMVEFMGIIVYHIGVKFSTKSNCCNRWCASFKNSLKNKNCCLNDTNDVRENSPLLQQPLPQVVHYGEYREPLIGQNTNT